MTHRGRSSEKEKLRNIHIRTENTKTKDSLLIIESCANFRFTSNLSKDFNKSESSSKYKIEINN
jgi:hypothetical protein